MGLKKLFAQSILWRGFYFFSILLVNIFLSRYLRAANTGNIYFLTFVFSFAQLIIGLSAESAIVYFAAGNLIHRNKFTGLIGLWSLAAGVFVVLGIYLFFSITKTFNHTLLLPYCVYGFLYVCGQLFTSYTTSLYYTKDDFFTPNFLPVLVNIAFVFVIPSKNKLPDANTTQLMMYLFFGTFFISGLLVYFSFLFKNRKEGGFNFPVKQQLQPFFKYAFTALAANIVFFLVYRIDYFFVRYSAVCSAADLGNYIQVSKLGQSMMIVPQIIASVVFPKTATGSEQARISNVIMVLIRLFSQIFLFAFIITALFGKFFFVSVFGESFNKMQIPMLIILPGIFCLSVLALLAAHFGGKGKIKINLYASLIGLSVMITGDFIFVLRYGINAAAIVSTVAYAANLSYTMWHFYQDHSLHWKEFIRWRKSDYNFLFSIVKKNVG